MIRKWEILIREAKQLPQLNTVVEIGTMRLPLTDPLCEGYGMSTLKFGEYVTSLKGEYHSVDIDEDAINNAKEICNNPLISFHNVDGQEFLSTWDEDKKIDLLYLDALSPAVTFVLYCRGRKLLSPGGIIVLDDCQTDEDGTFSKGSLVIPHAMREELDLSFYAAYDNSIMVVIRGVNI